MKEEITLKLHQFPVRSVVDDEEGRDKNLRYLSRSIESASENELLIFPELTLSGYIREFDPDFRAIFWERGADSYPDGESFRVISELVKKSGCYVVFGFCESSGIKYECYDSVALLGPKGLVGKTRKVHLPINEKHYFIPGEIGQVFETPLGRIGMMICYDMSFPETCRILALRGAEIVICVADWGASHNQLIQWNVLPIARAVENQVHLVACNRVGEWNIGPTRRQISFLGRSKIVSAYGEVLAEGSSDECVVSAKLTASDLRKGAQFLPIFRDRMPHNYSDMIKYVP